MDDQMKTVIAGQVRHLIGYAAGILLGVGAIQQSQEAQFISIGTSIAMWAIVASWSWWQKKGQADINAAFKTLTANVKPASGANK